MNDRTVPFDLRERAIQAGYFTHRFPGLAGHDGYDHILAPEHARLNIGADWRNDADALFAAEPAIQWHRGAGNGLSSQACCVNFLLPLADEPELLARWVGHVLGIDPPRMDVVEARAGRGRLVAFEWIGGKDYLHEAVGGRQSRGANSTAADAALAFTDAEGMRHLLLIEWKYTERYGGAPEPSREAERIRRYRDIAFFPHGPIRSDTGVRLTDLFWEPIYQCFRQQMLAWQVEHDPASGYDRVRVLHLSPAGNRPLHRVTSPALRGRGADVFQVFRSLLVDPTAFLSRSIEEAFALHFSAEDTPQLAYLRERYPTLCTIETRA